MTSRKASSVLRRGAAIVEFALVAPLLLLLVIGILEVGRMVLVEQVVANAVREGGRQASAGRLSSTEVAAVVRDYITRSGLPAAAGANATITVTNLTSGQDPRFADQLDRFRITAAVRYVDVRWSPLDMYVTSGTATISAAAEWNSTRDIPVTVDQTIPLY